MVFVSTGQARFSVNKRIYRRKPFKPIDHDQLRETRILAGLSKKEAAAMLHVTVRTLQNWETGNIRVPYSAFRLLRIFTGYELPGSAWKGWKLFGDALWSPEGKKFTAADLGYLSLTFSMARQWRLDRAQRLVEQQGRRDIQAAEVERRSIKAAPALRLVSGVKS